MRSNSTKLIRVTLIVYFVILVLFVCHVYLRTDLREFLHESKKEAGRDYADGWMLDSGEYIDVDEVSAGSLGGRMVISKVLPESMSETDAIYFSTSNLKFKVYVDKQLIYSYDTAENITGTGDGISYHMIGLGTKDEGDEVLIEAETVFATGTGGRINEMQFGPEELYRYSLMRRSLFGFNMSILMVIFGVVIIAFYFGMSKKSVMMRSLWALGLSVILFGFWSLCDTGIPQFLTGTTYAARETVYGILHMAGFPLIYFVSTKTKQKKQIYICLSFIATLLSCSWLLISRYVFGTDMHTMVAVIYISYGVQLLLLIVMLADNEFYCRRIGVSSFMKYFYIGAGLFVATSFVDMLRYVLGDRKGSILHGSWFRVGLVTFFLFMGFQIFDWWAREKSSLERDRFVNRLLQYIMDSTDPEDKINKVLEYLCEELHADRAYIFEDKNVGTFDNTYEYCASGVTPEIDNLKGLKYEGVIDVWYEEYKKGGHVLIYDLEKYRSVSENMYKVLKPQGIHTLVTGPLILEGEYIGFFGVDNPPVAMMEEISEIIRLLMFFLSELVAHRDYHRRLMEYSYQDALTGVGNRRAIKEFENEGLDTSRPYGFIMCDINGLKSVNDKDGHEAGDELIKSVASCLTEIFGRGNVYRMGGDEFAVYVYEDSRQTFESKIDRIKEIIKEKGHYVAMGYSYATDGDPDYRSRKVAADNKMYDEKRKFYHSDKDRRRPNSQAGESQ
ncbi:MAG: sensor domain-containing diguanylate cyclase [Lachnospiraceae bacterium]|nr:sensor domain-containing diguanylate cyclase [Lachnospiraceae bacterium]